MGEIARQRVLDVVLLGVVVLNFYAGWLWGWSLAHAMWQGAVP